ncbi:hypothetical protein MES5069_270203 [Mesorhizobium escarrei]|uniref:Uncharacterized protein n=1 Tax=Mesorhizobium escarrei TaxID=666018 RepID=A0ABM9DXW8_9HYPH|nr:hypothetical protein MES5069_270203 [Mesorhizobium escarrei]
MKAIHALEYGRNDITAVVTLELESERRYPLKAYEYHAISESGDRACGAKQTRLCARYSTLEPSRLHHPESGRRYYRSL